jgi:uncharacterized protein YidB (DUF937 family)
MGIMDTLSGIAGGNANPISSIVSTLFNQFGGVSGLIQKLTQSGHGNIAQSWIGQGQKLPIEPEQLRSAVGNETVDRMSQQSGLPSNQLLQVLAQHLPNIVSKLSPGGQVPSGNISEDQLKQGGITEMIGGLFNRKAG